MISPSSQQGAKLSIWFFSDMHLIPKDKPFSFLNPHYSIFLILAESRFPFLQTILRFFRVLWSCSCVYSLWPLFIAGTETKQTLWSEKTNFAASSWPNLDQWPVAWGPFTASSDALLNWWAGSQGETPVCCSWCLPRCHEYQQASMNECSETRMCFVQFSCLVGEV